jgi:3-isopropylmalate dehydratase small subunit
MQPFTTHTGIAVPLIKDDINTDQIAPVQSMRSLKPDYKALLFMRARAGAMTAARIPISCSTSRSSATPAFS